MIDIFERMGGGPMAGGAAPFHYYYPYEAFVDGGTGSGASGFPSYAYSASEPSRRGNGGEGYYFYDDGDFGYGDEHDGGLYFVDFPTRQAAEAPRKRKMNREAAQASKSGKAVPVETSRGNSGSSVEVPVIFVSQASSPAPAEGGADSAPMSPPSASTGSGKNVDVEVETVVEEARRLALSLEEAVVAVQSRVRGFAVRRTRPLEHLRVIAGVRAQLTQLEQKLADPDFIEYAREHVTGRLKLGETIMNLLFVLDGIQGVNTEVRDIRKSLTKKVIAFQERVDKIFSGNADDAMDVDVKHEDAMPEPSDDVVIERQAHATGVEDQSMEVGSDLVSTVESNEADIPVESRAQNFGCGGLDASKEEGAIGTVDSEMRLDEKEGAIKIVASEKRLAAEEGAIDTVDSEMRFDTKEGDFQMVASNVPSDDTATHGAGDQDGNQESVILKTNDTQNDDAASAGSLDDWVDVHVDDRTSRQEGEAVDTTMESDSDAKNDTKSEISADGFSDKKQNADDVWTSFRDYTEPPSKLAPVGDITVGAAAVGDRFLANPREGNELSTDGKDRDATLQRLSDENQLLKSLLLGVMKWNQLQAGSMNEISSRLGNLEKHFLESTGLTRKLTENDYKQLAKMLEL